MSGASGSNHIKLLSWFKVQSRTSLAGAGFALLAMLSGSGSAAAAEDDYKLGAQDRLRIHVYEWPQLTGEFTVGANGKIGLPLLGEVVAEGMELQQLGRIISERLKNKAKTLDLPDTSVAIVEYRPFYILGWVQQPGEYPFRPGMMALTAISIAGGLYRPPTDSGWSVFRDAITGYSDARILELKRAELTAREIRLRAEVEGADAVPPSATAAPFFLDQELALFETRRARRDDEIEALTRRSSLYLEELGTLSGQRNAIAKDRGLVEGELRRIQGLVQRGLITAAQSVVLERSLAQIEREALDIDTQVLRARQQISIAEQTIGTLGNDYRMEAAAELATVQAELREIGPRHEAALRMLSESRNMIAAEAFSEDFDPLEGLQFEITRKGSDGRPQQIEASRTTLLQPGDILEVRNSGPRQTSEPVTGSLSRTSASSEVRQLR